MARYLISYSTPKFHSFHQELNESARRFGINNVISYYETDLHKTEFYKRHKNLLDNPVGAGFWLWKPFFIDKALSTLQEGDLLLYVDAASTLIADPKELFSICKNNESGLMIFDTRPILNRHYCKRQSFINLNCDTPVYWDSFHCIATMMLIRKSKKSVDFVREWLESCLIPGSLDVDNMPDFSPTTPTSLEGFIDHRYDQSILSILVNKHGLETYRNPSKWGNYLKLPEFRKDGEYSGHPFYPSELVTGYSESPMVNSPYDTLFEINRKAVTSAGKQPILKLYEKVIKKFF